MQPLKVNDNLTLVPATMNDASFLFDLKNATSARASALATKDFISWDAHVAWLKETLQKSDVELYITVIDGQYVGSWRFDIYTDRVEGSQIISERAQGKRIGSTVFAFASDYSQRTHKKKMVMLTADGNVRAMRYHIKNNYTLEDYDAERKCYVWGRALEAFENRPH